MAKSKFNNKKNNFKISITLQGIINSLLILGTLYICYSQFFQFVEASATAIRCGYTLDQQSCDSFTYESVMGEKIFPERGFLCRAFGWDCFDEMIRKNETLTEIMNLWWTKGEYGDFSPYLRAFNPNTFFNYFCANVREDQIYPEFRRVLPVICPSKLRLCYPELAKTCPSKNI